jgi:hypothetical protein
MKFALKINYDKILITLPYLKRKIKKNIIEFILICIFMLSSLILIAVATSLMPSDIFDIKLD